MTATCHVLLPLPFDKSFLYSLPPGITDLPPGSFVTVPFGRQTIYGIVWPTLEAHRQNISPEKLKPILLVHSVPPVHLSFCQFIDQVADYTLIPKGQVLKMALNVPKVLDQWRSYDQFVADLSLTPRVQPRALTQEQALVIADIKHHPDFNVHVVQGVTGSGKSEIYLDLIAHCLGRHQTSLVLLPEIALSAQWLERFDQYFEGQPILWHSDLTPKQRRLHWQAVAQGQAKVVVGTRSALFLPLQNLGLIVVDEEHDTSFKQEEGGIYHARDMAIIRARCENCPILLVSATPSLETLVNVEQGRYHGHFLAKRYGEAKLPTLAAIDLRAHPPAKQSFLSPVLIQAVQDHLSRQEQVFLFLNRRGYSPLTLCRGCGYRFACPNCTAWLVDHHQKIHRLLCHHCGHQQIFPKQCPHCNAQDSFVACGPGVERIVEEVTRLFPDARLAVATSDHLQGHKAIHQLIDQISNRECDIIVGTQVLAKGYHFPHLTLVGVVDADLGLAGGDPRAAEKTFQLLQQVTGRAGRDVLPGHVYIQSWNPDNAVIQAMLNQTTAHFIQVEKTMREECSLPPFTRLVALILSGQDPDQVDKVAQHLARTAPQLPFLKILGPAPAPIAVIRQRHRRRFLIKAPKNVKVQHYLREWLGSVDLPKQIKLQIDIDPYSFL